MSKRTLVTAALPYANGSIHLGHLVEYGLVDMYVRARKALGEDVAYICADDAHGTPIEINARKKGIAPEELVAQFYAEHQRDFDRFEIAFDNFGTTHCEENKNIVEQVYQTLKERDDIDERDLDGNWCEKDQRFLPDRFIKGECPRCKSADQYGDVCEKCGATYSPTELKDPFCVLCGQKPVVKKSRHLFFKLSQDKHVAFLKSWIDSGVLQEDVANYVRNWIEQGLRDWCISRDGPYFGFPIPDMVNKFFYVWLDAPLEYVASSVEWGRRNNLDLKQLWQSQETQIEHVIGKDIMYFHTLFWPAVLHAIGWNLPKQIHVHGMLTVNGEKMSKSRGTFINANTFAQHIDPQALRYFYAGKYSAQNQDMDFSFDDFLARINGELVNKHANLFSRVSQFLHQKLDAKIGDLPFSQKQSQQAPIGDKSILDLAQQVVQHGRHIEALYQKREIGQVVRELTAIADIGNEFMQSQKPWDLLKSDPEKARLVCTFVVNVCYAIAMYIEPILPSFAKAGMRIIGAHFEHPVRMDAAYLFAQRSRQIGQIERLFERIERQAIEKVVQASVQQVPQSDPKAARVTVTEDEQITYDEFSKVKMRVGTIVEAQRVAKSKKLLRLMVDLGEDKPRQIISGLFPFYEPQTLLQTQVIVVANLKPTKLMGLVSEGMILAAEAQKPTEQLAVSRVDKLLPPGSVVR